MQTINVIGWRSFYQRISNFCCTQTRCYDVSYISKTRLWNWAPEVCRLKSNCVIFLLWDPTFSKVKSSDNKPCWRVSFQNCQENCSIRKYSKTFVSEVANTFLLQLFFVRATFIISLNGLIPKSLSNVWYLSIHVPEPLIYTRESVV